MNPFVLLFLQGLYIAVAFGQAGLNSYCALRGHRLPLEPFPLSLRGIRDKGVCGRCGKVLDVV